MKKILFVSILVVSALVFSFGCARVVNDSATITITGTILAANSTTPISGCTISTDPITSTSKRISTKATTTTASDGSFSITATSGISTIYAKKGSFAKTITVSNSTSDVALGDVSIGTSDTVPSMAVVPGSYDSIEDIITTLGYTYTTISESDLANSTTVNSYDIIFLNCGSGTSNNSNANVISNLQSFVNAGGSIYSSDWDYEYIESAFEDYISFYDEAGSGPLVGNSQTITATVLATSIIDTIGKSSIDIVYDLGGWAVIDSVGTNTTNLISGSFTTSDGTMTNKPLAAQFTYGSGTVIYTTFHNETQATTDMQKILQHYIFSL